MKRIMKSAFVCSMAIGLSILWADPSRAQAASIVPEQDRSVENIHDPLEPVNRAIFAVNDGLDIVVIRPIAEVYRTLLPSFLRRGIGNFLANVATPVTLANDFLQGDLQRAETTMVRFMLNTTAGLGGLNDIAADAGYAKHTEDFGQTLATWGLPSGPYLVLPVLGPSTPRHAVGRVVDMFANPWFWLLADEDIYTRLAPTAVTVINARSELIEELDTVRETSPDYYEAIKNLYVQNRLSEISNGETSDDLLPDIPDIDE